MQFKSNYPRLFIRSKNELAKHISGGQLKKDNALALINDVISNFDKYWHDSKESKPEKKKYIRSAFGNNLGRLLDLINKKVLATHDKKLPSFIYGGLSERSYIDAAKNLFAKKTGRTLIRLDIERFFEQMTEERVFYFFYKKCECSPEIARLLANLSCVSIGPKKSPGDKKTIARGFATSSRLAVWCNLDTFQHLFWKINRKLRNHDPRLSIFVDDIGISASGIGQKEMEDTAVWAEYFLNNFDANQPLPSNKNKKEIIPFKDNPQHLGLMFGKKKLTMGSKTQSRKDSIDKSVKELRKMGVKNTRLLARQKGYKNLQKILAQINKQ